MVALGVLVLAALLSLVFLEPDGTNTLREPGPWIARTQPPAGEGTVGTTGQEPARGAATDSGPRAVSPPAAVQDAQAALTGNDDWQERIGERVTLTLPLASVNDGAFWVGDAGERILVVLARDVRDAAMRQRGEPSGIAAAPAGGDMTVSGEIRRLPHTEAMYSWRLTNHDAAELSRRPIYVHVDRVAPGAAPAPSATNARGV